MELTFASAYNLGPGWGQPVQRNKHTRKEPTDAKRERPSSAGPARTEPALHVALQAHTEHTRPPRPASAGPLRSAALAHTGAPSRSSIDNSPPRRPGRPASAGTREAPACGTRRRPMSAGPMGRSRGATKDLRAESPRRTTGDMSMDNFVDIKGALLDSRNAAYCMCAAQGLHVCCMRTLHLLHAWPMHV